MFVKITRYLSISALAVSITLGCFLLMQQLLHQPTGETILDPELHTIVFEDTEIPDYQPPPPRPPRPEHEPPPEVIQHETTIPVVQSEPVMAIENINTIGFSNNGVSVYVGGRNPNLYSGAADDQLIQMVSIAPPYPVQAATAGIEGWVKIQFIVNAAGLVTDPVVIESQPKRVFDQAAIAAVLKWRFQPRSFKAQSLHAIQVIDFTLESD